MRLAAWIKSVDLPMPGSPPSNSTEPRTKPPPVTRSSSAMPEGVRGASWVSPVRLSSANARPLRFGRRLLGTAAVPAAFSSTSVFHSPQASHLPCQRLYAAPQFWQTKEARALAMKESSESVGSLHREVVASEGLCAGVQSHLRQPDARLEHLMQ